MRNYKSVLLATCLFSFIGCEDRSSNGGGKETNTAQSTEIIASPVDTATIDLDKTLRTSCADYSGMLGINGGSFFGAPNLDQADIMEVLIVDDSGNKLTTLFKKDGFPLSLQISNASEKNSFFAIEYPGDESDNNRRETLKLYPDSNLLITCSYQDVDKTMIKEYMQFVPLDDRTLWEKSISYLNDENVINNTFLETSILTDLHYKIYLENYSRMGNKQQALLETDVFMKKNFRDAVYKQTKWDAYRGRNIAKLRSSGTSQVLNYTRLRGVSQNITHGDIELINDLIQSQYSDYTESNNCNYSLICAALFQDKQQMINLNSKFNDGLDQWQTNIVNNSSSIGSINDPIIQSNPIDHAITLSLTSDHSGDEDEALVEIYQEYLLNNASELNGLFLIIENRELEGTCNSYGGCLASGLGGYYVCFANADDKILGCSIKGTHYDSISISIAIGQVFNYGSVPNYHYDLIPKQRSVQYFDIDNILSNYLAEANANRDIIRKIYYGAFAGEAVNNALRYCYKCVSFVDVNEVSLVKVIDL